MERVSPSHVGRGGFSPVMRLATAVGLLGGLHVLYQRSCRMFMEVSLLVVIELLISIIERFYGFTENTREVEMDMREMVDKVKKGEPLYGTSQVSSYLQGVAARNSRYSQLFIHVLPWINLVNHDQVSFYASLLYSVPGPCPGILAVNHTDFLNQHGVDTAKYYQQAERELEAERLSKA